MTRVNQPRLSCLIVLSFLLLVPSTRAGARPNATITNGDVHLRASYPTYGTSTLYKFQLVPGASLAVIPRGARVEVSAKKVIGNQEWFETTSVNRNGWVYAGDVGNRRYVQLDPGVEERLRIAVPASTTTERRMWTAMTEVLMPAPVHAQPSQGPVEEPAVETDRFLTLLFGVANLGAFLFALLVIRKWVFPASDKYVYATSFSVLLILGFVSRDMWSDVIAKWLVP
jgi:hypothetical protein